MGSTRDSFRDVTGREDDQFCCDRQTQSNATLQNVRLLHGRDAGCALPSVDVGGRLLEFPSHRTDPAEECKNRGMLFHGRSCAKNIHKRQAINYTDAVQVFCTSAAVQEPVNIRLKNLRLSAVPKLTIRKMAEELGIGFSRYSYFEDPKRFKKRELPLDLTRQIADVLARYGVDPAEVLKLAGLTEAEAEPEAREIEAARPVVHYFTVKAVMPSEAALAAMLEPLLALIPPEASRAEAARILAQRLPAGFAAIGPGVIEMDLDEEPGSYAPVQAPAKVHPSHPQR